MARNLMISDTKGFTLLEIILVVLILAIAIVPMGRATWYEWHILQWALRPDGRPAMTQRIFAAVLGSLLLPGIAPAGMDSGRRFRRRSRMTGIIV